MNRVMVNAEYLPNLIEKFWFWFWFRLLTFGWAGHIVASVNAALKRLITSIGQNCLKTMLLSHYQGEIAS